MNNENFRDFPSLERTLQSRSSEARSMPVSEVSQHLAMSAEAFDGCSSPGDLHAAENRIIDPFIDRTISMSFQMTTLLGICAQYPTRLGGRPRETSGSCIFELTSRRRQGGMMKQEDGGTDNKLLVSVWQLSGISPGRPPHWLGIVHKDPTRRRSRTKLILRMYHVLRASDLIYSPTSQHSKNELQYNTNSLY